MKRLLLALICVLVSVAAHAGASSSPFHPDLVLAQRKLDTARGAEAYAALRAIWSTWDRADPTHVEEALLLAESSPKLSPPARAYAGWLAAHARTRRGDLAGAKKKIAALGYIDQWLVVGPFDNEGKQGLAEDQGPEAELTQPIVPGRAYSGKERPVRWRVVPKAFPYGWVDLSSLLRPDRKICGVLRTFVHAKKGSRTPRAISLWVGNGGAFRLFWNGKQVLTDPGYRAHDADRFATAVTLEPGENDLTLKVCGDDAAPLVSVRIGDERGAPDPNLEVTATIAASEAAAKHVAELVKKKAAPPRAKLEGPMQSLEQSARQKNATPSQLYAYADYLVNTGGDDPADHDARDLARRAAEREPTVERLLLAGDLAEDKNQRKEWVDKAVALAKKSGRPNVDVLLAQADLELSSPNWRAAVPYLDRALAIDPDNVDAMQARVQLNNDAGLKRTALAALERAVDRNPRSVNLLNMLATQLRALGRDTEAAVAEDRYASLRFDDRTFLNAQIDLAVARRNKQAAERWVSRLLAADPDSQWAHGVAARAYRALGQPDRSIAAYREALNLAPEDVGTLRALADLYGELGKRDEQLSLLRNILKIRPQDKDVREYVEHIQPSKPRPDEAYAWNQKRFLRLRHAPKNGETKRVLRDLTVTTVFENGLSSKFRQVVFQPLTDAAAAVARQYAFQYQADREVVQLRGARVFRGDGKVDEAIESGEGAADNPAISMYTSARNFYVQLPRLDPGDVVELRYRIDDITPNNELADYFGEVVYMQSDEPTQNAEYVLITPKSRTLYVDEKVPNLKREVKEAGSQRIYRFFSKYVPPASSEPAMPPWPEVLGYVHVSTYKSWQELGKWYWGLVKDQFDLDDETRKLAREITKGKKTDADKVKAVYDWVVENTRYVALEFGIYGYKPRRCVQTVARGWGDCKDKATVIATLLEEVGIPSTIVILRTQMRGDFDSKVASLAPFDHAIVYVPSMDLYLDGTAEYTGSTELPMMDMGALGLRINRGDAKLVHLPVADPTKNVTERKVVANVESGGNAKLEMEYHTKGVNASEWRRRYHAEATRRERVNGDIGREFPGFNILPGTAGITTSDLENIEQPVSLTLRGSAPGFARREGKQLSIAATVSTRLTPSYASLSSRTQDVVVQGFSTQEDTFVLKLPAGMKLTSAPPEKNVDTPFGSFSVKVSEEPGQITVKSRLAVKVMRIHPKDYAAWKKFCADADSALTPRVTVGP
ncbi:MAG: DUF3857 domain-containing protein [Myxococcales bacterium]|nr:DUF3857 domain-containing protein [Myxococcales bacterium]MCB9582288.1 DUF3857 domain-containing protein [Polyangiaceae bacterium]